MAPYAEAVLRQPRTFPLLRAGAELLKARHERSRTRTLERSLVQMQTLAEAVNQPLPPVATRLRSAPLHPPVSSYLPPFPLSPSRPAPSLSPTLVFSDSSFSDDASHEDRLLHL